MQTQITHYSLPNVSPEQVAQDLRDMMDDVYHGEIEESQALPIMAAMFDFVLPHFESLPISLAEQVTNAAEWLDRLDDLPN